MLYNFLFISLRILRHENFKRELIVHTDSSS